MKKNTFNSINLLRIIACLMVFFLHSLIYRSPAIYAYNNLARIAFMPAWAAVWIFFIISGYFIGKSFYQGKVELNRKSVIIFYVRRYIRIFPLYFIAVIFIILIKKPDEFNIYNWKLYFNLLTFTFNGRSNIDSINATWYISTLFQFYFLSPLFYYLVKNIKKPRYIFIVIALLLCLNFYSRLAIDSLAKNQWRDSVPYYYWDTLIYKPFWQNLDMFFVGFLVSGIKIQYQNITVKRSMKIISILSLIILILYNIYIYSEAMMYNLDHYYYIYRFYLPSFYVLSTSLYLYSFDEKIKIKTHLTFISKTIDGFNKISYGFYIWHSFVIAIIAPLVPFNENKPFLTYLIYTALAFFITTVISVITYLLIEKQFEKIKIIFEKRIVNEKMGNSINKHN